MNKITNCLLATIMAVGKICAQKTIEISGPILAPWVKGELCAHYKNKGDHITRCFTIASGKKYILTDIPDKAQRIKITRSFTNQCVTKKHSAKKCKKVHGSFYLNAPHTILSLTYNNNKILKNVTLPPAGKNSYFGHPQQYGSVLFPANYRSQPDSRAV